MRRVSECMGQFLQDAFVIAATRWKRNGTFLDIGAGIGGLRPVVINPGYYSNTYLLENEFGWDGLCIDYDQRWCDFVRPFRSGSEVVCEDLMHRNINNILEENNTPKRVNYLSFDVDDAQEKVFQELDFEKYQFDIVTFEHNLFQSYDDCDQNHTIEHKKKVVEKHEADRERWCSLGYYPLFCNVGAKIGRPVEDWYINEKIWGDEFESLAIYHSQLEVATTSNDFTVLLQELGGRV